MLEDPVKKEGAIIVFLHLGKQSRDEVSERIGKIASCVHGGSMLMCAITNNKNRDGSYFGLNTGAMVNRLLLSLFLLFGVAGIVFYFCLPLCAKAVNLYGFPVSLTDFC